MRSFILVLFSSLCVNAVKEIDIIGSSPLSPRSPPRSPRCHSTSVSPRCTKNHLVIQGDISISHICEILELSPLSDDDKTLPGAGELVDIGTHLGSTIGSKIIVIGVTIGLDAILKAVSESLLAVLAGGDMTLLPLAIAGFLIKLGVPDETALVMAEEIYRVIAVEWGRVSRKVKELTLALVKAFVFAVVQAFWKVLKDAGEAARPDGPPEGPWYIPDIE